MQFRLVTALALLAAVTVWADDAVKPANNTAPVKRINSYVQPYYESAETPDGHPRVAVSKAYDAQLSSNRPEDIIAVRDRIKAQPQFITPMTLMVLAIRLYDVGLRDDAVFWFYAAKNRYITMTNVLDMKAPALASADDAIRNFIVLAGPFFNGYAFCNLDKQRDATQKSIAWVEDNAYQAVFAEQLPALPGDRKENLKKSVLRIRENAEKEKRYLSDAKNLEEFRKMREANHVIEQFCWGP